MTGLSLPEMNNWRDETIEKFKQELYYLELTDDVKIVNPVTYYNFETPRHQTEIEVEEFDLAHVTSSDIVIVNLDGLSTSIGTVIELHDAHYHHKVPVIAFGKKSQYDSLHPWVKNDITRVEDNIDDVIHYIIDFYLS